MANSKQAHARIYRHWLNLGAWQNLSGTATKTLIHLLANYRPSRAQTELSEKTAARMLDCSPDKASKAIRELADKEFIRVERAGGLCGQRSCRARIVSLQTYPATAFLAPPYSRMPFGRIDQSWLTLPAWRALSGDAVKLLAETLAQHEEGAENYWPLDSGHIQKRLGCGRGKAAAVRTQLVELGWMRAEGSSSRGSRGSLSQFRTYDAPAEPWRYERWLSPVFPNTLKSGLGRSRK